MVPPRVRSIGQLLVLLLLLASSLAQAVSDGELSTLQGYPSNYGFQNNGETLVHGSEDSTPKTSTPTFAIYGNKLSTIKNALTPHIGFCGVRGSPCLKADATSEAGSEDNSNDFTAPVHWDTLAVSSGSTSATSSTSTSDAVFAGHGSLTPQISTLTTPASCEFAVTTHDVLISTTMPSTDSPVQSSYAKSTFANQARLASSTIEANPNVAGNHETPLFTTFTGHPQISNIPSIVQSLGFNYSIPQTITYTGAVFPGCEVGGFISKTNIPDVMTSTITPGPYATPFCGFNLPWFSPSQDLWKCCAAAPQIVNQCFQYCQAEMDKESFLHCAQSVFPHAHVKSVQCNFNAKEGAYMFDSAAVDYTPLRLWSLFIVPIAAVVILL